MTTDWNKVKEKLAARRNTVSRMRKQVEWLVKNLHDAGDFDVDDFIRADTAQVEDMMEQLPLTSVAILIQHLAQSSKYQKGYYAGIQAAIQALQEL